MANGDISMRTPSYFSDWRLHRVVVINPTPPPCVLICLASHPLEPKALTEEWPERLGAGGLLNYKHSLLVWKCKRGNINGYRSFSLDEQNVRSALKSIDKDKLFCCPPEHLKMQTPHKKAKMHILFSTKAFQVVHDKAMYPLFWQRAVGTPPPVISPVILLQWGTCKKLYCHCDVHSAAHRHTVFMDLICHYASYEQWIH